VHGGVVKSGYGIPVKALADHIAHNLYKIISAIECSVAKQHHSTPRVVKSLVDHDGSAFAKHDTIATHSQPTTSRADAGVVHNDTQADVD
jgi:hypothetical protein